MSSAPQAPVILYMSKLRLKMESPNWTVHDQQFAEKNVTIALGLAVIFVMFWAHLDSTTIILPTRVGPNGGYPVLV